MKLDCEDHTNSCPVYPETKGVPLEEMDAVFGEGEYAHIQVSG